MSNLDTINNQIDTCEPEKDEYNKGLSEHEYATLIVQDILRDILHVSFEYSDCRFRKQLVELDESVYDSMSSSVRNMTTSNKELYNEVSRNYKDEFLNILQNLKCKTMKIPHAKDDSALDHHIRNIINEIKQLEASIQDSKISEQYLGSVQSVASQTEYKVDFKNKTTNLLQLQEQQEIEDEVVLQIIHHDDYESSVESTSLPNEDSMEEVNLRNPSQTELPILAQGDQMPEISSRTEVNLDGVRNQGGEIDIVQPVPDPEPDEKLNHNDMQKLRNKKKMRTRIWNFITKNSTSECE